MKDIEDEAPELAEIDKLDAEIKAKRQTLRSAFVSEHPEELVEIDKLAAEIKAKQQALDSAFVSLQYGPPNSNWGDMSYQFEADYADEHAEIEKLYAELNAKHLALHRAFVSENGPRRSLYGPYDDEFYDEHVELAELKAEREAKSQAFVAKHGMLPEQKKQQQEQQKKQQQQQLLRQQLQQQQQQQQQLELQRKEEQKLHWPEPPKPSLLGDWVSKLVVVLEVVADATANLKERMMTSKQKILTVLALIAFSIIIVLHYTPRYPGYVEYGYKIDDIKVPVLTLAVFYVGIFFLLTPPKSK
jgi:hypothetical protein